MSRIETTFLELINAIESSQLVTLSDEGQWCCRKSLFRSFFARFFPDRKITEIAHSCLANFDRIERIPLEAPHDSDVDHLSYLSLARYLEKKLRALPQSEKLLFDLMRKRIALQYRCSGRLGGEGRLLMGYVEYRLLYQLASRWKKEQAHFHLHFLTQHDQQILKKAAQYPQFVDLLLEYPSLQDSFFRWTLQNNNPVEVFIEFPAISDWIVDADLSNRLGRVGDLLRVETIDGARHVTLMFEGQRISIMDPKTVIEFRGKYRLSVEEIFSMFSRKYHDVGNLEVFEEGITNWNGFQLGHWDAALQHYVMVDLLQPRWWENLPVLETITRKDAQERYKIPIPSGRWVVAAHATRGNINLSYEETHAFIQIAIPICGDLYRIYDFGKYGLYFPKNYLEVLNLFAKTMPAGVMYPDDNTYSLQRQHGYYPLVIDPDSGRKTMDVMRQEFFSCLAGKQVYQIETDNCARWTHEVLSGIVGQEALPNLYQMPLIECEPGGFIQSLFGLIKKLPKKFHTYVLTRMHYGLGAWRGMWIKGSSGYIWRSVSNHEFFDTGVVYLPALVIEKREQGLFDIEAACLENRTKWRLVCEKVVFRNVRILAATGVELSSLVHDLLTYLSSHLSKIQLLDESQECSAPSG